MFPLMVATTSAISVPTASTPLLDGRCQEAEWHRSRRLAAEAGYSLRVMRDSRFVYLCVDYPEQSLGMLDLFLKTEKQSTPLHLHASAKLGEARWTIGGWTDLSWWNERGWSTQVNGFDQLADGKVTFHRNPEREFQFSLARFGEGKWQLLAEILNDRTGSVAMRFPQTGDKNELRTYFTFQVGKEETR